MSTLQVVANRIIVSPDTEQNQKRGSLHVPETAKTDLMIGEIISVGSEVPDERMKIGTRCAFNPVTGAIVNTGKRKVRVMGYNHLHYIGDRQAIGEKIILKLVESREEQDGLGLILPDTVEKDYANARIVSVGPEVPDGNVKVGKLCAFDPKSASDITDEDGKFVVVQYDRLLYLLEN